VNRCRHLIFITVVTVLIWSLTCATVAAQDASGAIDIAQKAANSLITWFKSLVDQVQELATAEDRRRLIEDLTALSKAIYDLEQEKRYLLLQLQRQSVNVEAIDQAVSDSDVRLKTLRERLRQVGLALREQFRHGGKEVEKLLMDATGARKFWLEDVLTLVKQSPSPDVAPLIVKGQETVEALAAAHEQIVKLIDRLREVHN